MEPINYGALQTQLDLSPLQRGFAMRRDNRAQEAQSENQRQIRQLAQAKFTADQENDQEFRAWLPTFSANPTSQALLEGAARFPGHSEALQAGFKTYQTGQQQDVIGTVVGAMGAASAGNYKLAVDKLTERRDALKRDGIDSSHTDAAIKLLNSDDPAERKQGMAFLASGLWGAIGPEATAKIMDTYGLGAKADRDERRLDVTERASDLAERRIGESERHNRTMEGFSAASSSRADRKAAGSGSGGGKKGKLPSGFILD